MKPHDTFRKVKISVWFCRKVKGGKIVQDWIMKGLLHCSKETELHLRKLEVTERGSHKKLGGWMSGLQRRRSHTTDCRGARREAGRAKTTKKGFTGSRTRASEEAVRDEKENDLGKPFG